MFCLSYFNKYYSISSDFLLDVAFHWDTFCMIPLLIAQTIVIFDRITDNYPALSYRRRKINLAVVHRKGTKSAVKLAMMVAKGSVERTRAPVQISNTILTRQWRTTRPHSIPKR